jgi:hypothetical protein
MNNPYVGIVIFLILPALFSQKFCEPLGWRSGYRNFKRIASEAYAET